MKLPAVRKIALSLPETTEEPHFHYTSFRVRGKLFATAPPSGEHLNVFIADENLELALALHPGFIEKLHWGKKVAGVRVMLGKAPPHAVAQLLQQAWLRKAPKKLSTALRSALSGIKLG